MMKPMAVTLAALLVVAAAAAAQQAAPAAPYIYQGTIQSVEPRTGAVSLLTGVGFALRVVPMTVTSATRIEARGASLGFGALRPGDVVRAECRRTAEGLLADRIERLAAAP